MDTKDILDECKRVMNLVDERMDAEGEDVDYSWEDAIEERGLSKEDGLIVLTLIYTAQVSTSQDLSSEIHSLLFPKLSESPFPQRGVGSQTSEGQRPEH